MKRISVSATLAFFSAFLSFAQQNVVLENGQVYLEWSDNGGYFLDSLSFKGVGLVPAEFQRRVLFSSDKPSTEPLAVYGQNGEEIKFPDPKYRYITASWQQNNSPVALNRAGESICYKPSEVRRLSDKSLVFTYQDGTMRVEELWETDDRYASDIKVTMSLVAGRSGWYSLVSPSLSSSDKNDFIWATVPGVYQGNTVNTNFINALAYGHGIPDIPVVSRERTATTLTSILSDKSGVTLAVTAEPGTGRDPWESDRKTQSVWKLGLSLMNRDGEFTPTLYSPVLGERGSYAESGDTLTFCFRYSFSDKGWYSALKHASRDIYKFGEGARLRTTSLSLSERIELIHKYLVNDSTSKWRNCEYDGVTIGAQDYLGGVYDSEKDAMKNADYGAMWMLSAMTGDDRLALRRLPYALNFKLKQQNTSPGFFNGSSAGQYYLYKSSRFTEEWGPYTEPIATTYYMLMDLGNILLFEPSREDLKESVRLAADCLLRWMNPDGSWEVAYDNRTGEPLFRDVKDLRPTFYGLYTAWKILGEDKYLEAACKGADWYIRNGVSKGCFLGVCGDTRFAPDFATVQSVRALLDLFDATGEERFKSAAISAAKIYTASIYTHPVPSKASKTVKGVRREDWEISQAGLSFEHGGVIGSANHRGPILLASHAGLFVQLAKITGDGYFLDLARSAAFGRDAFVDMKTGVASYYWDSMNAGAGPFPHHAWWQLGWMTDYLVSEAWYRSGGKISFPGSFVTPKVGPHRSYGFAPGKVYGKKVSLVLKPGFVKLSCHDIEYLTAVDDDKETLYVILMNNDDDDREFVISLGDKPGKKCKISGYGIDVMKVNLGK